MRREDYRMPTSEAIEFLRKSPVIHLATTTPEGAPVFRTVHGVVVGDTVAFHGAPAGEKTECEGREVVLSAEEIIAQIPSYFIDPEKACPATTYYKSVQVHGVLEAVNDLSERAEILMALMKKFQPEGGYVPIDPASPMYKGAVKNLMIVKVPLNKVDGKGKLGQNRKPEELKKILESLWRRGGPQDVRAIGEVLRANPKTPTPYFLEAPSGVTLCCTPKEEDAASAAELLKDVYWNVGVSTERLIRAHLSSPAWVCAYDEAGKLIASARALTDAAKWAWIYDVIVDASWRGKGVGEAVLRLLLDFPGVRDAGVVRLATKDAQTFYQKFGFFDAKERPLRSYTSTEMLLLRSPR